MEKLSRTSDEFDETGRSEKCMEIDFPQSKRSLAWIIQSRHTRQIGSKLVDKTFTLLPSWWWFNYALSCLARLCAKLDSSGIWFETQALLIPSVVVCRKSRLIRTARLNREAISKLLLSALLFGGRQSWILNERAEPHKVYSLWSCYQVRLPFTNWFGRKNIKLCVGNLIIITCRLLKALPQPSSWGICYP